MRLEQLFDLSGRTALVTGGSRGLGLAMAGALGEMGAKLAITARKADDLEAAADTLRAEGHEVFAVVNDLATPGTPTRRQCPPESSAISSCSIS